jgi:hypothetical protein
MKKRFSCLNSSHDTPSLTALQDHLIAPHDHAIQKKKWLSIMKGLKGGKQVLKRILH